MDNSTGTPGSPWGELGGDYFVRALQEFARSTDRRLAELTYEKAELEAQVAQLESVVEAKDRVLKEYLRRIALLEFAVKRDRYVAAAKTGQPVKPTGATLRPESTAATQSAPMNALSRAKSCRDIIRHYLEQAGELSMPIVTEADLIEGVPPGSPAAIEPITVRPTKDSSKWELLPGSFSTSFVKTQSVVLGGADVGGPLCTGSDDGLVKVWTGDPTLVKEPDMKNLTAVPNSVNPNVVMRGHSAPVTAGELVGSHLVTGDESGTLIAWRMTEVSKLELFPGTTELDKATAPLRLANAHYGRINQVCVSLDSTRLASCGNDKVVNVYAPSSSGGADFSFAESIVWRTPSVPTSLAWHPLDGNILLAGFTDGSLASFDVTAETVVTQVYLGAAVSGLSRVDQFNSVAVAQVDGSVKLIDINSATVSHHYGSSTGAAMSTCISAHSVRMATGSVDGLVKLWDMRSHARPLQQWTGHTVVNGEGTLGLALSDELLASCGADGKVNFYRPC